MANRIVLIALVILNLLNASCSRRRTFAAEINDTQGLTDTIVPVVVEVEKVAYNPYLAVRDSMLALVGIEETSENCSPEIKTWARRVGLDCPVYWCALTTYQAHYAAGLPYPKAPAFCPNWFIKSRVYWNQGDPIENILVGTEAGYFFKSKGRIAHIGMVTNHISGALEVTEGNASKNKHTRNGTVCIPKIRQAWEIYKCADWTK